MAHAKAVHSGHAHAGSAAARIAEALCAELTVAHARRASRAGEGNEGGRALILAVVVDIITTLQFRC